MHMPKAGKKVVIDQTLCIGCNTCPCINPQVFELDKKTYKAKVIKQPDSIDSKTKTAIDACPVKAISLKD